MSRTMAFKRWMFAKDEFEETRNMCELISICSMVIWVLLYSIAIHTIGIPEFLQGKLIGVLVVLYGGILITGAFCVCTFLVLAKVFKLERKQVKMNMAKKLFKNLKDDEDEP